MKNRILLIISIFWLAVAYWMSLPDENIRIVFCDVGEGDGAIVMRGTFQMLIDVGPDNGKMQRCLGRYIPFWDREIEVVVISHNDKDHTGGLEGVRKRYDVQKVYSGELRQNDVIRYGQIEFEILSPEKLTGNDNDDSVVGLLKYKDKRMLFLGDVSMEIDQRLVWRGVIRQDHGGGGIDILKVSHHGSETGTSRELIEMVGPRLAVISVGKNNSYGHPNKELLERLRGIEVRRTDEEGDIVVGW